MSNTVTIIGFALLITPVFTIIGTLIGYYIHKKGINNENDRNDLEG